MELTANLCALPSADPHLHPPQPHHPTVPAGWNGQRLGPLHLPRQRGIGKRGSPRRGPRGQVQVFWGAAEMRWRQTQLHNI